MKRGKEPEHGGDFEIEDRIGESQSRVLRNKPNLFRIKFAQEQGIESAT
jgi:hypothetical protein